jgi:pyrrolidone-carboxylate peptidase
MAINYKEVQRTDCRGQQLNEEPDKQMGVALAYSAGIPLNFPTQC